MAEVDGLSLASRHIDMWKVSGLASRTRRMAGDASPGDHAEAQAAKTMRSVPAAAIEDRGRGEEEAPSWRDRRYAA